MAVQIQIREETVQARLSGEIDHHSAAQMREKIDESVIQSGAKTLVLDFSLVTFMDSSGIGILLNRYKQMQRSGGSVAIYGVGVQINRILNLGGIWNLINGFSSKEAAIAGTEG